MQQLHLVGFTTDLEGLIFSARRGAKSGSFVVPLDEKLVATIAEAHRRRNGDGDDGPLAEIADKQGGRDRPLRSSRPESRLSPREIQGRLRTGRTIAEVAREADVDPEWVERWAAPVMAEQHKIITRARALTFAKPRGGSSVEPLGRSVAWSVADKGVWLAPDQFDRAWSAYQSLDSWIVRFHYRSRGRDHVAEWEVTDDDELIALDRTASQLAYLDRARRRKAPPRAQMVEATEPAPEPAEEEAAAPAPAPRARRATGAKKGRARATTKKRATSRGRATAKKRAVGRPAAAKRARATKKTGAKKTTAKKTTAKKTTAKKTAAARKTTANKTTAAKKTAARKASGRTAKKAPAARKAARSRKAGATRKAARKSAAGRGPGGRRPPAEPAIPRAARARQAASVMLSTEPEVVAAPRFGTPGNPPARRSGAGGRRTVVKARGKKAVTAKARPRANARAAVDAPSAPPPESEEFMDVAPAPAPAAARPSAPTPEARRRRQPRLRASVRRRESDDEAFDGGGVADDEEPAVVFVARPGEDPSRAQISADRAGDLVGDQGEAGDGGVADGGEALVADEAPAASEGADAPGGLLGRRRRRLLRR